jgi:hypothetical protein
LLPARLALEGRGHTGVIGGIVSGMGKNIAVLASVRGDAGDLIHKTVLLEGELAEAH